MSAVALSLTVGFVPTRTEAQGRRDPGCNSDLMPTRVRAPSEFATFVILCRSRDSMDLSIKNLSAGVICLTPCVLTTWSHYIAPTNDFLYQAGAAVVRGGPLLPGTLKSSFRLRPSEQVQAESHPAPVCCTWTFSSHRALSPMSHGSWPTGSKDCLLAPCPGSPLHSRRLRGAPVERRYSQALTDQTRRTEDVVLPVLRVNRLSALRVPSLDRYYTKARL